jgi:hypothetical protein
MKYQEPKPHYEQDKLFGDDIATDNINNDTSNIIKFPTEIERGDFHPTRQELDLKQASRDDEIERKMDKTGWARDKVEASLGYQTNPQDNFAGRIGHHSQKPRKNWRPSRNPDNDSDLDPNWPSGSYSPRPPEEEETFRRGIGLAREVLALKDPNKKLNNS